MEMSVDGLRYRCVSIPSWQKALDLMAQFPPNHVIKVDLSGLGFPESIQDALNPPLALKAFSENWELNWRGGEGFLFERSEDGEWVECDSFSHDLIGSGCLRKASGVELKGPGEMEWRLYKDIVEGEF